MLTYIGTPGDDFYQFGSDFNLVFGLAGDDTFYSASGDDSVYGGYGIDTLSGGDGNDILVGGYGDDLIFDGDGNDLIIGGYGNDGYGGGNGNDYYLLREGHGTDFIDGFGDGQDVFLLAGDLVFEQLTITQTILSDYSVFDITITSTGEVLVSLATSADAQITEADFITI